MPAPLAVDWSGIRAAAIAIGNVSEAARQAAQALPEDERARFREAVSKRAVREQWLAKAEEAVSKPSTLAVHEASKQLSKRVQSGADAVANTLAENQKGTKLGLSAYARRMAERAAERGELEEAPLFKAVADIHGKMFPEDHAQIGMQLNHFSITLAREESDERPVIDV